MSKEAKADKKVVEQVREKMKESHDRLDDLLKRLRQSAPGVM